MFMCGYDCGCGVCCGFGRDVKKGSKFSSSPF